MTAPAARMDVVLEVGSKRVFATAVDWPGWSRSARTEEAALQSLLSYADRYAPVAALAGFRLPAHPEPRVVETVPGNATTDFGAPAVAARADHRPVGEPDAARLAALVAATWETLDTIAATAPAALRKGPRGGGRDRDAMVAHVASAEAAYARKVGLRLPDPAPGDRDAWMANRAQILGVLGAPSDGERLVEPKGWPQRYAAQRVAWHVLDHVWEIQDRS